MATNCCDTEIDGVTAYDMILMNPTINGGTMVNTVFAKDCTGADVRAGDSIATCTDLATKQDQLLAYDGTNLAGGSNIYSVTEVDAKVAADILAATSALQALLDAQKQDQLKAADGTDLAGATNVYSVAEVDTKVAADILAATNALQALLDAQKQDQLKAADGTDLAGATNVYSVAEVDAQITTATTALDTALRADLQPNLLQCDGTPLPGGAQVPLCAEVTADIAAAVNGLISEVVVKPDEGLVGKGTAADPLGFELELHPGEPPYLRGGGSLPTMVMGEKTYLLGEPATWLVINTESGKMAIPAWFV